jgi:integrase
MERDVLPVIGDKKAKDITPPEIADVLRPVVQRHAPVLANHIRANLHAMFNWGASADLNPNLPKNLNRFCIAYNPVTPVPKPLKGARPGNRFLSEDEVRKFWWGLQVHSSPIPMSALRLMLCTGARVLEVTELKWDDLNLDESIWHLQRTKNGRAHEIPLNKLALAQIRNVQPFTGHGSVVFPKKNSLHYSTDSTSLNNVIRRLCPKIKIDRFTPRDLRRTVKSLALKYGATKQDMDLVQNHALGSDVSSVHYIRYDWLREKQRALNIWNKALQKIVYDPPSNDNKPKLIVVNGP